MPSESIKMDENRVVLKRGVTYNTCNTCQVKSSVGFQSFLATGPDYFSFLLYDLSLRKNYPNMYIIQFSCLFYNDRTPKEIGHVCFRRRRLQHG